MNLLLTTSTAVFVYVLILGSAIVYLVLKYDKKNRQKLHGLLLQAEHTQPFREHGKKHNVKTLKATGPTHQTDFKFIEQQLDELVQEYDKGRITLPEYCSRLNRLLSMTA